MMCHQYAYAEQVPEQCDFALTALKQPEDYRWHYPEEHEEKTILPPMAHKQPRYEFVSAEKDGYPQVRNLD